MKTRGVSSIHWQALASRHPSVFLLATQLLSLVLYALLDKSSIGRGLLTSFGLVVLALAVWVISHGPLVRWATWVLVVPAFALSLLSVVVIDPTVLMWSSLLEAVLYFYATGSMIAYMMEDYRVTTDELFSAGATFTLLAWGFANAYQACQAWLPGSFLSTTDPGQPQTFLELLFVSFTNLSATGLSDITPATPPARVLVMLEQFSGVGYIAVVVSRLIGMTIVRQTGKDV